MVPEDALPAIERARQVIVVGDQHQLPPTTFFQVTIDDEDTDHDDEDDKDSFEGRESILDVMVGNVGAGIAERHLTVHYRSLCESLIRFSNHQFYEGRLLTFPGPDPGKVCVRDEYLFDATYDVGGTRTNRKEAERIADIVFELMETNPSNESIGVIALSRPQADLIEDLIEQRRLSRSDLDERFREERDERFFVKNLENVQGDERDHMILSIGYGPTQSGAVPNRFGPINQTGGERRLNVAVSRARKSMTVVHSLKAEDITSHSTGARQLRRYLEYVRNPETALEAEVTGTGEPESPFEEAVLTALRKRGHKVASQVGVSGYRIDLAIRSENGEGFDLGIECDGATYHMSPAARDRDWLRQKVLEKLGWRIHRVWSTSWNRNNEAEIAAIEEALQQARTSPYKPPVPADSDTINQIDKAEKEKSGGGTSYSSAELMEAVPIFDDYQIFECEPRSGDLLRVRWSDLLALVRDIVEIEQPVYDDTVITRVRQAYNVSRAGKNVSARISQAIKLSVMDGALHRIDGDDTCLSVSGNLGQVRPRQAGDRSIKQIPAVELDEGLLLVARKAFGIEKEDLLCETARQFGYRRTGSDIAERLNERINHLMERKQLSRQGNMLVASDDGSADRAVH